MEIKKDNSKIKIKLPKLNFCEKEKDGKKYAFMFLGNTFISVKFSKWAKPHTTNRLTNVDATLESHEWNGENKLTLWVNEFEENAYVNWRGETAEKIYEETIGAKTDAEDLVGMLNKKNDWSL